MTTFSAIMQEISQVSVFFVKGKQYNSNSKTKLIQFGVTIL